MYKIRKAAFMTPLNLSHHQFYYNQQPICTILAEMTDADKIMHPQFWDGYDGLPDPD